MFLTEKTLVCAQHPAENVKGTVQNRQSLIHILLTKATAGIEPAMRVLQASVHKTQKSPKTVKGTRQTVQGFRPSLRESLICHFHRSHLQQSHFRVDLHGVKSMRVSPNRWPYFCAATRSICACSISARSTSCAFNSLAATFVASVKPARLNKI